MSTSTRDTVLKLVQAWNAHDPEAVAALAAPSFCGADIADAEVRVGPGGAAEACRRRLEAFSDLRLHVEALIVEGDRAALAWRAEATHTGAILSIPRTGRRVEVRGVTLLQVRDGQVLSSDVVWDVAGMLRGLGLLPELS